MKSLFMAVASDIHLGHRRNPAADIIRNLRAAFPDNAKTAELDIIWLAGDIFDDLLNLPDESLIDIDLWIAYMLRLCAKHDIVLRILEGTPSHDWKQSQRFETIEQMVHSGADMKYVRSLSIEYIERFGINVLYVPDEWDAPEKTIVQVRELLRAKGLDQVDYAIMHGQFEYQLPPIVKAPKHSSSDYLALVKHLIFIGHVHIHTRFDRIIAQGSFDRLTHGEEGPKGHVRARVWEDGERDVSFMENTGAMRFVSVSCIGYNVEQTLAEVAERVENLPAGSHVRVETDHENPILTNMEQLIRTYPLYIWSKLVREPKEVEEEQYADEEEVLYMPITLTKDNLGDLLMERLANNGVSEEVLLSAREILTEVI